MHVNNGSNSHQELKDFVYITYSMIQTLKNTKHCITLLYEILPCSRCLYGDIPWNSFLREFCADGRFFCLWGHFVVGSQNTGCCKQPLGEGGVGL